MRRFRAGSNREDGSSFPCFLVPLLRGGDLEQREAGGQVDGAVQGGGGDLEDEASVGSRCSGVRSSAAGGRRPGGMQLQGQPLYYSACCWCTG